MSIGVAGAAAVLVAPFMTGQVMADQASPVDDAELTGPLADEMADLLELQPGGVQVSDNAMAWEDGTVVVWPDPGEERAPAGLGANVRAEVADGLGLLDTAGIEAQSGDASSDGTSGEASEGTSGVASDGKNSSDLSAQGTYTSCPSDYYCFYTDSYYNGTRYQFSSTCSGYASSWGFGNQTTSWVNRSGSKKIIYAYNYEGGPLLWYEPHPSQDSYVGSSDNNRMSYWRCTHT